MKYSARMGAVEVDGIGQLARAAAIDCTVVRPGLALGRGRRTRRWTQRLTRLMGVELDLGGLEHVDPGTSYAVVALHEGIFDPLAVLHLPLEMRFAVRSEVFGWPGMGRYLRASGHVAVDPERGRSGYRRLLEAARAARAAGHSLVVFPQGSILGIETAFAPGAIRAAERAGLPVLPVVITGSHRVWEHPFSARLRFGVQVGMQVLPPAAPGETELGELEAAMKAVALSGAMPPPRRFKPERDGWWDGHAYEIDPAFPELAERLARHRQAQPV